MNVQGRPTRPETKAAPAGETFTGNRGLDIEEALIFEIGRFDATGVDIDEPAPFEPTARTARAAGELSGCRASAEPEVMRHYVRLSRKNYAIDAGLYPLGLLHHEAQSAPQREDGAAARLRRRPSAAAASRPCRARSN